MALMKISVEEFLEHAKDIPVIDVRSPSEFKLGHIPGAINIPLFDDKEREIVGTKYKKEGRIPAILTGLECIAPSMSRKLEQVIKIAKNGRLLVHCWRGGMRSETMSWFFSLGDINVELLVGGYKSYRNYILKSLSEKRKMIVLGGMTGSGKTYILHYLKELGQQVIDLEQLANHKGSAFGSLGQPPQPSSEHFTNILFDAWDQIDRNLPFWIEDESRNIGSAFIPERFYLNMQEMPTIVIMMDVKTRLPSLLKEYSNYPREVLKVSLMKISKRLGGDNTRDAVNAVETGDFAKAIGIALHYYDKAYLFGLKKKHSGNIVFVETNTSDIEINANKILRAAGNISW
jgi:tRNA 2-selenouridine synthase